MFYVYEHWRPDRDEPFYVGKGKGSRANMMARRNPHHKAIQAKLHRLGLAVEVRIIASSLTEEEAFEMEKSRIAMWVEAGIDLANKTIGGEGSTGHIGLRGEKSLRFGKPSTFQGRKHTEEAKKKVSIANKGKQPRLGATLSEESKEKISKAKKGKKLSEEHRVKLSQAHKARGTKPPVLHGEQNPFFGKTHREETKLKLSIANKGQNHPHYGKKQTAETRAKRAESIKNWWAKKHAAQ